mmetsp:Transcript_33863/g.41524  ORF Transcript_33863/g.41524 Transcript_33863/m.41524 type:complete len:247 (-) Transcript_33863:349-1089(-)
MSPTDDQTLRICRHLLLSSPPGQFDLILSDLRNVLTGTDSSALPSLTPAWINTVRSEYQKRVHDPRAATASDDAIPNNEFHASLKSAVEKYVRSNYSHRGVVSAHAVTAENGKYTVTIFSERISLANFNAGSWSSRWIVDPINGSVSGGAVDVRAHCFENGNVQLRSLKEVTGAKVTDPVAANAVKKIKEWEEGVMAELEEMYEGVGDGMLKSFRRVLPLAKVKMDWDVNVHRFVKTLNETSESMK